jgi:hypothetical protein
MTESSLAAKSREPAWSRKDNPAVLVEARTLNALDLRSHHTSQEVLGFDNHYVNPLGLFQESNNNCQVISCDNQ